MVSCCFTAVLCLPYTNVTSANYHRIAPIGFTGQTSTIKESLIPAWGFYIQDFKEHVKNYFLYVNNVSRLRLE